MSRKIANTLSDVCGERGGKITVRCQRCGRETTFDPLALRDISRRNRWSEDWRDLPKRFKCHHRNGGCGAKDAKVIFWIGEV